VQSQPFSRFDHSNRRISALAAGLARSARRSPGAGRFAAALPSRHRRAGSARRAGRASQILEQTPDQRRLLERRQLSGNEVGALPRSRCNADARQDSAAERLNRCTSIRIPHQRRRPRGQSKHQIEGPSIITIGAWLAKAGPRSRGVEFALDSPLEGNGFEPPVPREIGSGFEASAELGPVDRQLSRSRRSPPNEGANAVSGCEASRN
jgi:hypothetical protein